MTTIKKYTDENGVTAKAVLSDGERKFLIQATNSNGNNYTIWEFIQKLCNGTWVGGNVYGFNGYVGSDMFTVVEDTSSMVLIEPTESDLGSDFDFSAATLPENGSDWEDLDVDMSQFNGFDMKPINSGVTTDLIDFKIRGTCLSFANVRSFNLEASAYNEPGCTNQYVGGQDLWAYIVMKIQGQQDEAHFAGIILRGFNFQNHSKFFNATFSIPDGAEHVSFNFELWYGGRNELWMLSDGEIYYE